MKIDPLSQIQTPTTSGSAPADPALHKAASEFEQILLRKMLSSLEKTGTMSGDRPSGGGEVYSSMVVGALAEAISSAGGIGLADVIERAARKPEYDYAVALQKAGLA